MMDTTDIILCSESMVALQFLNIDLGPYVHVKASSNVHVRCGSNHHRRTASSLYNHSNINNRLRNTATKILTFPG